jgi:hypothetical protein
MTANAVYSGPLERKDLRKRSYILTTRDRILGALFVLLAIGAQVLYMGPAIALLCLGLVFAYMFWVTTRWTNNSSKILPIYLLAIFVQCLHCTEEYLTGFQLQFPRLLGYRWSNEQFLIFNGVWLAIFVLAAVGVYRGVRLFPGAGRRHRQWGRSHNPYPEILGLLSGRIHRAPLSRRRRCTSSQIA